MQRNTEIGYTMNAVSVSQIRAAQFHLNRSHLVSLHRRPRIGSPFSPKFSSSTSISPEAGFPRWLEAARILNVRYFYGRATDYSVHIKCENATKSEQKYNVPPQPAVEGRANWGLVESKNSEKSSAKVTFLTWRQSPILSLQIGGGTFTNLVLSQEENA